MFKNILNDTIAMPSPKMAHVDDAYRYKTFVVAVPLATILTAYYIIYYYVQYTKQYKMCDFCTSLRATVIKSWYEESVNRIRTYT